VRLFVKTVILAASLAAPPRSALATGVPDPNGRFQVVLRDVANNPIANWEIIVDFSGCSDLKLCDVAPPGQFVDCRTKTVRGYTDAQGSIWFDVVGEGTNLGASPGPATGCAKITAQYLEDLISPTVNIYDQNGAVGTKGMEVTDLSAFLKDLGTGMYFGRSDYNQGGALEVIDLSVFLSRFGTGFSSEGCTTTYCP